MAEVNTDLFVKNVFTFLVMSHEKLLRPFEESLSGTLSPLQFHALAMITSYPLMNMSELAERLSTTKQQATQIVNRLVELDLVERRFDLIDRRVIKLDATKAAQGALDDSAKAFCRRLHDTLATLTPAQQAQLWDAVLTLNELLPLLGPQGESHPVLPPPGNPRKYL